MDDTSEKIVTEVKDESALTFLISVFTAVDLKIFLARLLRKRNLALLICVPVLFFSFAAIMGKMYIENSWKAKCVLFRNSKGMAGQRDMPEIYSPIDIGTVVKTITKRSNAKKVIKQLNLDVTVAALYGMIKVEVAKNKSIITISVTNKGKKTSSEIANAVAKIFLESYVMLQRSSSIEINSYYKKTAAKMQNDINVLENQLNKYLTSNNIISTESEISSKFDHLNEMQLKLVESTMLKSTLDIRLKHIDIEMENMKDKVPLSYMVSSGGKELAEKERLLSALKLKYTDMNPRVIRVMEEIKSLRESEKKNTESGTAVPEHTTYGINEVKQSLKTERSSIRSQLLSLDTNISKLQHSIESTNGRLAHLAKIKTLQSQLDRKINSKQELLQKVNHVISMTDIASNTGVSDIKILEEATPPVYPESSMKKVLAIAGFIFGLVVGLIIVFVPEILDFSVKSAGELSKILKIKSIGMLPDKDKVKDSIFYEALQIFIEEMTSIIKPDTIPVTAFCGSTTGTGKSYAIENLTEVLIKKKLNVLYIDSVHEVSEDIKDNIINDYLYNDEKDISSIKANKISNNLHKLYFNLDAETFKFPLDKNRLDKFLNEQKKKFDYIIIELFTFNENRQLFSTFNIAANSTVLVSKFRRSNKFSDKTLIDLIKNQGCENVLSLVNYVDAYYYRYLI